MSGKELSKIRRQLRWTQSQLADAVGVAGNTVARWERGELGISEPVGRLIRKILAEQRAKGG